MKNILKLRLNRHLLSAAMGVGMLAALIMGSAGTALADGSQDTPVNLNVTTGGLTESVGTVALKNNGAPLDNTGFQMDGLDHTIVIDLPITAQDWSGTGSGWNVTIAAGTFTTTDSNQHTLQSAPKVTSVGNAILADSGTDGTAPLNAITVGGGITLSTTSASPVFSAAAASGNSDHTGMGQYSIDTKVTQTVKADDYIPTNSDSYKSTFTVAIVTGPSH